ncbi:hypothetical protein PG994_013945 [Apiospora phragmitis]|uniref:RRM domain-containing protein n=1 Tax=Apiospora phragmitis TaxID=2905665 RepID=A0ABR1T592_9PEZI
MRPYDGFDPLAPVEPTADGARHFDTTSGPSNASVVKPPPAPRNRLQASGTQIARALRHVSGNYEGSLLSENLSAPIPARDNCSLFVGNLPSDLTHEQLFAALKGIGRIASIATAERLKAKLDNRQIVINGLKPNALWNKVRVAAQQPGPDGGYGSRVIRVTGDPFVVNEEYMLAYFSSHFFFELGAAPEVVHRGKSVVSLEVPFTAYINQAENAYRLLRGPTPRKRVVGSGQSDQSYSLFIRNLPPWLTYAQLFDAFRGVGRFAAVHINRPTEEHATSAAKVAL